MSALGVMLIEKMLDYLTPLFSTSQALTANILIQTQTL